MRALAALWAIGAAAPALAQPATPVAGLPHSPAHYLLQALLSLALVIALIYGAYWLLRRVGPGRAGAGSVGPAELVQSLPLHGGYMLHVVRVGTRLLTLTCGPGGVTAAEVAAPDGADTAGEAREDSG